MLKANQVEIIRLKNGQRASLRPAQREDAPLIEALHQRSSDKTLYNRYHQTYKPSLGAIDALCQMEAHQGAVVVATVESPREIAVAVGYYVREEMRDQAELALLVEDQFQGLGLGRQLLMHLQTEALRQGISQFMGYILPSNEAIMKLLRRSGLPFHSTFAYGTREVLIDLMPSQALHRQAGLLPSPAAKRMTETMEIPPL